MGKVYSFEAQEKLFYALAGNIAINNCFNVSAKNAAVGSRVGNINIPQPNYLESGSYGSLEIRKRQTMSSLGKKLIMIKRLP